MATPLLLDTCAAIWIAEGSPISADAKAALADTRTAGLPIVVSPMTAWEIGMLVARGKIRLSLEPGAWFSALLGLPGMGLAELGPATLIASSFLPGAPPRDPVDRIVAATARAHGYSVVTRDRLLLGYAEAGNMLAVPC
jgi:PIN domain nuclease of toxin-antitoxin system